MKLLHEMIEQLKQIDEVTLIEMLNLSSEDIVERCRDLVENDQDRFEYELAQWFEEEPYDDETEEG